MIAMSKMLSCFKRTRTRLYYTHKYRDVGAVVIIVFLMMWYVHNVNVVTERREGEQEAALETRPPDFINVVEDERDAVNYWQAAASSGAIPSSGNILLHFGAYTADASPHDKDASSRNPYDENDSEFHEAMESAFVKVSAVANLISRFIWVFPHFLDGPHKWRIGDHIVVKIKIGHTNPKQGDYVERCHCVQPGAIKFDPPCFKVGKSSSGEDTSVALNGADCFNMTFTATVAFVCLNKATTLARSWDIYFEKPILDINENVFACEPPSFAVNDVKIPRNSLVKIAIYMRGLICLKTREDEILADQLYFKIVQNIIDIRHHCKKHQKHSCNSKPVQNNILTRLMSNLLEQHSKVVCSHNWHKRSNILKINKFIGILQSLHDNQLAALRTVGVCLPSNRTNDEEQVSLCLESSGLTSDAQTRHGYTAPEADETENRLHLILSGQFSPGVVSVSRSTRGGCTPRKQQKSIEAHIFKVLAHAYPDRVSSVHYDDRLLGGKPGWYYRYGEE